jgi:hypothetical protein
MASYLRIEAEKLLLVPPSVPLVPRSSSERVAHMKRDTATSEVGLDPDLDLHLETGTPRLRLDLALRQPRWLLQAQLNITRAKRSRKKKWAAVAVEIEDIPAKSTLGHAADTEVSL